MGKGKTINIKNFGGTRRGVPRLSHAHVPSVPSYVPSVPWTFCPADILPLELEFPHKSAQTFRVSWDIPNLSLGRFRSIPTTKFLYVIFLLGCTRRGSYSAKVRKMQSSSLFVGLIFQLACSEHFVRRRFG